MTRIADRALELLAKLPSTNARIVTSLVLALGTGIRYVAFAKPDGWEPSIEWLGFLVTMMGLDVAQFAAKRSTHVDYVKARNGGK